MTGSLWLGECPEPGCALPAELLAVVTYESTDGPVRQRRTRCVAGHTRDSHPVPAPLPRQMECPNCSHEAHTPFRCDNEIAPGVRCPCRDVPVPGIYHPDEP